MTFKGKKTLSWTVVGLTLIACGATFAALLLPSHKAWQSYYNQASAEAAEQERINSLPKELVGLDAALNEDVEYYANGKAAPKNEDFTLTAHYTEKGRSYDEYLTASDFTMTVPNDFAAKGGTIQFSYTFTPEAAEGEEATPETKEASLDVSLVDVALKSLVVTTNPDRVYYDDTMSFQKAGLVMKAVYNDGSTVEDLDASQLTVVTTGTLAAGTTSATVSYTDGKTTVTGEVPIKVVAKKDYDDGTPISMKLKNEIVLSEGQPLSEAKPQIYAEFQTGNKFILSDSEYNVTSNVETASYMKNCILTFSLKAHPEVQIRTAATVRKSIEAEAASVTGGETKTVTGYVPDIENPELLVPEASSSTVVEGPKKIVFTVTSESTAQTNFFVRLANRTKKEDGSVKAVTPAEAIASMKINGRSIPLEKKSSLSGWTAEEAKNYRFETLQLPDIALNPGDNTIDLEFSGNATLAVDSIQLSTRYTGRLVNTMSAYLQECAQDGKEFAPESSVALARGGNVNSAGKRITMYLHAACADDQYLYLSGTDYNTSLRNLIVQKLDPTTKKIVAYSSSTNAPQVQESSAGICVYDNKLIALGMSGNVGAKYIDLDDFTGEGKVEFKDYDGFHFEGFDNVVINDLVYNSVTEQFALRSGTNIYIYDKNQKQINSFTIPSESGLNIMRMTASSDNIFVNYSADGHWAMPLQVFDWKGNHYGRIVVPNTLKSQGVTENFINKQTNVQGITFFQDAFYFINLSWSQPEKADDGPMVMRAGIPAIPEERNLELNFGEYVAAVADQGKTGQYAVNPVVGDIGYLGGSSGYSMGGASDGKNIYLALNTSGNAATEIYQVNPSTFSLEAKSATLETGLTSSGGDNSQLFVKDGKLYCIVGNNQVYSVAINDFKEGVKLTLDTSLPFAAALGSKTLKGIYFNDKARLFALLTTDNVVTVLDEDGTVRTTINVGTYNGLKITSVTGDDKFLYTAFTVNNQSTAPFKVYTYDGTYVGMAEPGGLHLKLKTETEAAQPYNIQGVFFHQGEMYVTFCTWSGTSGLYLWKIGLDYGVFD